MQLIKDVPLSKHSTMCLGGKAAFGVEIDSREDLTEAVGWAWQHKLPVIMIGYGSNIVWRDDGFPGLLLINRLKGYEPHDEDEEDYFLTVGAGENWDSVVARSVAAGASGIEALSLIPGTVGATPVQNVGAYGQEISQTLVSVEAYDINEGQMRLIPVEDCGLGYRTSRFKTSDRGRFLITRITLHLLKTKPLPPYYPSVERYFKEHQINDITPNAVRDAVIAIRRAKLPDVSAVANNGSFFANPIIDLDQLAELRSGYPNLVYWEVDSHHAKLSAAWLIEQAGFSNYHDNETGMATWPKQSLVLVNEKAKSTSDLLRFKQKIVNGVQVKFGVKLIQEPELLP